MIFNNILYKDLNPNQLKLIKWLEKNMADVKDMSINEVAEKNYVSTSFITKTLKKCGFFGWKDFKGQAKGSLNTSKSSNGYLQYLEDTLFKSISNSISHIDEIDIIDLAKLIARGDKDLFFIGEGFSYHTALDQARRYNKLGVRAFAINAMDYELASIRSKDIVVFISASGITSSIQESMKILKDKNINSTLITLNKSVTKGFSKVIYGVVYDSENFNEREYPKHSRIIMLTILDWVYTKVQKIKNQQNKKN